MVIVPQPLAPVTYNEHCLQLPISVYCNSIDHFVLAVQLCFSCRDRRTNELMEEERKKLSMPRFESIAEKMERMRIENERSETGDVQVAFRLSIPDHKYVQLNTIIINVPPVHKHISKCSLSLSLAATPITQHCRKSLLKDKTTLHLAANHSTRQNKNITKTPTQKGI